MTTKTLLPIREAGKLRFIGNCMFCGAEFKALKSNRVFCTDSCRVMFGRRRNEGQVKEEVNKSSKPDADFDRFIENISLEIKRAAREGNELKMNTLQRQKEMFILNNKSTL